MHWFDDKQEALDWLERNAHGACTVILSSLNSHSPYEFTLKSGMGATLTPLHSFEYFIRRGSHVRAIAQSG